MSKARFNHTIGALVITAVVLVATILLNVVVSLMSDKLPGMSIDLTSKGAFQLSETSIKLAQNVKKDLKITFLDDKQSYRSKASSNTYYAQVMAIAEEYGKYNNKISAEYVSIVDNPNLENKYPQETLSADNIIVSCGDKYRILDQYDIFNVKSYYSTYSYIASSKAEEAFDGAILAVTSTESTKLAIVEDNSTEDFTYFKNILEQNNYELVSVKLEQEDIPKDAKMLIVLHLKRISQRQLQRKFAHILRTTKNMARICSIFQAQRLIKRQTLMRFFLIGELQLVTDLHMSLRAVQYMAEICMMEYFAIWEAMLLLQNLMIIPLLLFPLMQDLLHLIPMQKLNPCFNILLSREFVRVMQMILTISQVMQREI